MQAGLVTIGYAGACLFAGTGVRRPIRRCWSVRELKFTTGFTGTKQ